MSSRTTDQPNIIGKVETIINHLEMFSPPAGPSMQPPPGAEIVRALAPTLSFYRYLYDNIGGGFLWSGQRVMDQSLLHKRISHEDNDVRVLWVHGVPAGMAEFDFRDHRNVELLYFGLLPEFIGRGLGRFLIGWSVRHAFAKGAERLWVHTCDLDHPTALGNYERAGFELFDRETAFEIILEGMPIPEHAKDRPILPITHNG